MHLLKLGPGFVFPPPRGRCYLNSFSTLMRITVFHKSQFSLPIDRSHILMFQVDMNVVGVGGILKPNLPTLLRVDSCRGRELGSNPRASSWRFTSVPHHQAASRGRTGMSASGVAQGGLRCWGSTSGWERLERAVVGDRSHKLGDFSFDMGNF